MEEHFTTPRKDNTVYTVSSQIQALAHYAANAAPSRTAGTIAWVIGPLALIALIVAVTHLIRRIMADPEITPMEVLPNAGFAGLALIVFGMIIALGPVNANPYPPGVPQLSEAVTTCIDAEIGDRTSREVIVDAGKDCLRSEWAAGPAMGRCQTELAANTEMWNAALVGPVAVGKLAGQFTIDNCASALGGF